MAQLDAKLEQRTAELRAEFQTGLAALETKLIRWMVVLWAGSTLTILGTMLALFRG